MGRMDGVRIDNISIDVSVALICQSYWDLAGVTYGDRRSLYRIE